MPGPETAAKLCTCPGLGAEPLECAECYGEVHVLDSRRELLRDAVIETARAHLAAHLRWEREENTPPKYEASDDAVMRRDDALQTLRDACHIERRARGGAR